MAQQKVSDTLFEALDIIINKRIEAVQKDKTILCVVEDNSKAEEGEYVVSNTSTKFTAYSENTEYRNGQNVWVLIPEGDYNNEKKIIGKHVGDSSTPYIYVDPMDSYANMTGSILNNNKNCIKDDDEYVDGVLTNLSGLVANYSAPINIFSGERLGEDGETQLIGDENVINLLSDGLENSINNINAEDLAAYDRLGISADFKTAFGSNQPTSGSYGLFFIITTAVQTNQTEVGETPEYEYRYIPVTLDSSQMWGNPYNYANWSTQTICYDIDTAEQGTPVGIDCYFYQNFDFNDGEYPYQYDGMISLPNLFVKDINVSFGYAVDNVEDDTIFLFTKSNNTYIVDNKDYVKLLETRFIYVGDDNATRIAINSFSDLNEYLAQNENLKNLAPMIRWYRYKLQEGVQDKRAGDFWEEFYPDYATAGSQLTGGWFSKEINDLISPQDERFKCILCYNPKFAYYIRSYLLALNKEGKTNTEQYTYHMAIWTWWFRTVCGWTGAAGSKDAEFNEAFPYDTNVLNEENRVTSDDIWEQWAASDQRIVSKELIFTNQANAYDSTRDLVQALRLTADDSSNGVFNIYEATYSANSHLINPTDERIARKVKATFWSAVTESEEMNEVERLAWYVPRYNTMIKRPEDGLSYGAYTQIDLNEETYTAEQYYTRNGTTYSLADDEFSENNIYYEKGKEKFLDTEDAINNLGASISDEEKSLFLERIKDYYIILEDDIQTTAEKTKEATLVYYIKPELKKHWTNNTIRASAYRYKRNYEGENAQFTPTFGAKGTNGTDYTLSIDIISEIAKNDATYSFPPAWTWINGDDDTKSMVLYAQLYDPNDKEVEGATYTWEFLYPANGKINNATEWTISADSDDSRLATLEPGTLITNYNSDPGLVYRGAIIKCTAKIATENKNFTRYFIIPMRRTREYIGFEGPTQIRYASSGTQPQYYNAPIGLFDIDENIIYNNTVRLNTAITGLDDAVIEKYLPVIKQDGTDEYYYHLFPKAMYFKDVNYGIAAVIYDGDSDNYLWSQPLLILIDPYGNEFLNNWGGELNIDYDNNTIMSAVMGAGKKESDNSFTGLLLGDLPKVDGTDTKTGLLGYEHGEQAYGIFDDGTMFLGKSSRAQLKFNGSEGLIQNAGYDYGHGIKIDFDGGINTASGNKKKVVSADTNDQHPYIDIKDANGAQIYLSTDGTEASPYLKVKSPDATGGKDLLHIESASYYLQTENYKDATDSAAGTGLKIDLANGTLNSYNKLTINGAAGSTIHFGDTTDYLELGTKQSDGVVNGGYLNSTAALDINGAAGSKIHFGNAEKYLELGYNGTTGYLTSTGSLNISGGSDSAISLTGGQFIVKAGTATTTTVGTTTVLTSVTSGDRFLYLSNLVSGNHLAEEQTANNTTTNQFKVGPEYHTDWKLIIGSNFGVRNNGEMIASAGNIGGWTINSGELASGSTHLYSQNQSSATTIQGSENKSDWRININNVFGVDSSGNLYASAANLTNITVNAANINGTLTADQIDTDNLTVKAANIIGKLTADQINVSNLNVLEHMSWNTGSGGYLSVSGFRCTGNTFLTGNTMITDSSGTWQFAPSSTVGWAPVYTVRGDTSSTLLGYARISGYVTYWYPTAFN